MCPLPFTYFAKTTTIVSAASDSNDGRDPLGCGLTNGIFTFSTLNVDRNSTGSAFTGGTDDVVAGDYIYLTFGSGTSVDGLYEVASVTDASNLVLVADAGLIDDSTTVTSSDGPWLTLQYAFDTPATTGDQVVICDDGNGTGTHWEYNATLDVDANEGGLKSITVRGGGARGTIDGTVATISGASHSSDLNVMTFSTVNDWVFMDLRFTGAGGAASNGHNIYNAATGATAHKFYRCRFDNADDDGIAIQSYQWSFFDCEIDNNGGRGIYVANTTRGNQPLLSRCRVHHNGSHGAWYPGTNATFLNSLFYRNGGDGLVAYRTMAQWCIDGCIFAFNTGDGLGDGGSSISGQPPTSIHNSIFRSNGVYGVGLGAYGVRLAEISHCCFSNNTSGTVSGLDGDDRNGHVAYMGLFWDDTNVYTDPLFTSEVDGSEDFTLQTGSPCLNAGIGYSGP